MAKRDVPYALTEFTFAAASIVRPAKGPLRVGVEGTTSLAACITFANAIPVKAGTKLMIAGPGMIVVDPMPTA